MRDLGSLRRRLNALTPGPCPVCRQREQLALDRLDDAELATMERLVLKAMGFSDTAVSVADDFAGDTDAT